MAGAVGKTMWLSSTGPMHWTCGMTPKTMYISTSLDFVCCTIFNPLDVTRSTDKSLLLCSKLSWSPCSGSTWFSLASFLFRLLKRHGTIIVRILAVHIVLFLLCSHECVFVCTSKFYHICVMRWRPDSDCGRRVIIGYKGMGYTHLKG